MLSIRATLERPAVDMASVLRRTLSVILEGVCLSALPCGPGELACFQERIERLRDQLERLGDRDAALALTGDAIRCIEGYGALSERCLAQQKDETNEAIRMLAEAFLEVSGVTGEKREQLRNITAEFADAGDQTDVIHPGVINTRLEACLQDIGEEVAAQKAAAAARIEGGRPLGISQVAAEDSVPVDIDTATGLPGAQSAIHAIRSVAGKAGGFHLLAFAVERMETINLRFGFKAGDEILMLFAQHLAGQLAPGDVLFRWRGPCFVVLTERSELEATLAKEASRAAGARLEHTLTIGEREVNLPVASTWTLLTVPPDQSACEVLRGLDEFAIHRVQARV